MLSDYPTNKVGRSTNIHLTYVFLSTESYAQSVLFKKIVLINKILPMFCSKKLEADYSELSWNLLRGRCWLGIHTYHSNHRPPKVSHAFSFVHSPGGLNVSLCFGGDGRGHGFSTEVKIGPFSFSFSTFTLTMCSSSPSSSAVRQGILGSGERRKSFQKLLY